MLKNERVLMTIALGLVACAVDVVRLAAGPAAERARGAYAGLRAGLAQIGGGS